jgi:hypothetical protein
MSEFATNQVEYFLGIEGEQKGPYSKEAVLQMLSQGEITEETPVWFQGMSDWTSVGNLDEFKPVPQEPVSENRSLSELEIAKEEAPANKSLPFKRMSPTAPYEIAFSGEEQVERSKSNDSISRLLVLGVFVLLAGAGIVLMNQSRDSQKTEVAQKPKKPTALQIRTLELSKLQTEFNKDPVNTAPAILQLIKADPKDNVGLEGLEILLTYYRQQQQFREAGKALMTANRPGEALEYFLKEPPDFEMAAKAYEGAANSAKGEQKKEFLIKEIELLISRLGNLEKAIEQIKVLNAEFPGVQHPYQYYLKTTEERIADIFSRISFGFTDTLNTYISAELPQIQFSEKPLVQIIKDKNGAYRVVGSFKGPVNFRNDNLPNIFFVFWWWNEQWNIVDTNLTKERAQFAQQEQKKHSSEVLTAPELLKTLENIFKTQFPGKGLHEQVSAPKKIQPATLE